MAQTDDAVLREQLAALLKGGQAHASLADAVAGFPEDRASEKVSALPYSAWQLVEHIRIGLHDILDFCTNSDYVDRDWPADYWPKAAAPGQGQSWQQTIQAIQEDLASMESLIRKPESNLYSTIPWGKNGETLLREVLLAADHTSYHTGELIVLRRVMGVWK